MFLHKSLAEIETLINLSSSTWRMKLMLCTNNNNISCLDNATLTCLNGATHLLHHLLRMDSLYKSTHGMFFRLKIHGMFCNSNSIG
jgi:hypothetical protein